MQARKCFPLPDLQPLDDHLETASKSSGKPSKAGSPPREMRSCTPTEAESVVTPAQAGMLAELASLQKQQALLEELLQLQELRDFEWALQEEEEQMEQALRRSAVEAEEQELLDRKRSVEAPMEAQRKIPKATHMNESGLAAILGESTKAESCEAKEAPAAILESAKAESREAEEAPESAKAESREAEEAPAAILESAKAESREAEEAPTAILGESAKAESREAGEAPEITMEPKGVVCFLVAMLCATCCYNA